MVRHALKVFAQVCHSGSFTKAAAKLYVTPNAIMQQMDALEKEYGMTLLTRTRKGVRPTAAGEFLLKETESMIQHTEEVFSHLRNIAQGDSTICVGTSVFEKCRLLYDLWTLYCQKKPACRIEMVNIHADFAIPDSVDLIEGLNGGVTWMQEWDFFEICQVPIGIAMENSHRLAHKESIDPADLAGEEVGTFKDTAFEGVGQLLKSIQNVGARLKWMDAPSPSVFWECAFQHRLFLAPLCWSDILPGLTLRPVHWPFTLPYGVFSRTNLHEEANRFLDFIRKTYSDNNPDTIIPVLTY